MDSSKPRVTRINSLAVQAWRESAENLKVLTLVGRGVQIAATDLTSFLPIRPMLEESYAYAQKLLVRMNWSRNHQLGVPPKAGRVRMLPLVHTHRLQLCPSRFCCNLFAPFALFSHFGSELCMLNLETLEHTHQGIVRNGKRFKNIANIG
ncbi:hypothetical protein PIB30_013009 [Stylosanthes scabra]|uniref:Uncharacterized protein n=1 Tax=Stylosanthes scabra TaxID=79078 RepID=A0ABU6R577_9FABA|nr:hypothetical protein [Stylosanthes scabra]